MSKRTSKQYQNKKSKPRKYLSLLKEQGYKISEINDCIQAMMAMDMKELSALEKDSEATILEKTVAKAMLKSLEKGSLHSMKTLLNRVYGNPRQTIDKNVAGTIKINVQFNDDPDAPKQ